jgi:8-oxo-dGTP diphosphatase
MTKQIFPVVIGAVLNQGKILLTKRQEECQTLHQIQSSPWQIPGGGLEFGETVEECVIRELKEETGLDVEIVRLIPKVYSSLQGSWHGLLICFVCKIKDPSQPVVINNEASAWRWCTLEETKKLKSLPLTYAIAAQALQ